jgi:protein-S-isoprenylcysteine O-methyltransferase Ste14
MSQPSNTLPPDWITRWQRIARRIRVPLGFLTGALYLFDLWHRASLPAAVALSLVFVLPGLLLRAYASGYVRKNRELTVTGPYAYTRNPLYLGSILIAAGFALALQSWPIALVLAIGFAAIYIPVIASEERFLRSTFPGFEAYSQAVPRLIPRLTPARQPSTDEIRPTHVEDSEGSNGSFSFELYLRHHEYNAAIGAVLLYLSLLFLRPAMETILHWAR